MEDHELADRLVSYADAIAAVAFVGISGLGIALGDPDVRCSIASALGPVVFSNLVSGTVMTILVLTLRRWELELRTERPPGERARAISRNLHVARIAVVWLSTAMAVLALFGASRDTSCGL